MPGAAPRVVSARLAKAFTALAVVAAVAVPLSTAGAQDSPAHHVSRQAAAARPWTLALEGPVKASYVSAEAFARWRAAGIRLIVTTRSTWSAKDHARLAKLAAHYELRLVEPVTAPRTRTQQRSLQNACAGARATLDACAVLASGAAEWHGWRTRGTVDFVVVHVRSLKELTSYGTATGRTRLIALAPLPAAGSGAAWSTAVAQVSANTAILGTSVGSRSEAPGLTTYLQVIGGGGVTKPPTGVPTPTDTTPPTSPSALAAQSVTPTSVTLGWSPASDAVGVSAYEISLSSVRYGTTTSTTYTIAGLACGTTYTVGVRASDEAGNKIGSVV